MRSRRALDDPGRVVLILMTFNDPDFNGTLFDVEYVKNGKSYIQ